MLFRGKKFVIVFSIVYFLILIYLLFFAFFREGTTTQVNLVPFKSIVRLTATTLRTNIDWWHWLINVPGNIVAFMPMALPLQKFIRPKLSPIFFIATLIAIPVAIELLQYFFQTGSCDVDDIILNVTGIFCGILVLKKIEKQPAR